MSYDAMINNPTLGLVSPRGRGGTKTTSQASNPPARASVVDCTDLLRKEETEFLLANFTSRNLVCSHRTQTGFMQSAPAYLPISS